MPTALVWLGIITLIHVNILLLFIWYNVFRYILRSRKLVGQVRKEDRWGNSPVSQVPRHIIKPIQCPSCDAIAAIDEHNALWKKLEIGASSVTVTCRKCNEIFEFNPDEEE